MTAPRCDAARRSQGRARDRAARRASAKAASSSLRRTELVAIDGGRAIRQLSRTTRSTAARSMLGHGRASRARRGACACGCGAACARRSRFARRVGAPLLGRALGSSRRARSSPARARAPPPRASSPRSSASTSRRARCCRSVRRRYPAPAFIGEVHHFFHVEVDPATRTRARRRRLPRRGRRDVVVRPARRSARGMSSRRASATRRPSSRCGVSPTSCTAHEMKVAVVQKRTTYRKFVVEEHDPLHRAPLATSRSDGDAPALVARGARRDGARGRSPRSTTLGVDVVFRGGPRGRIPTRVDLVITIGGDGTLLAASHQIGDGIPLLGINSAPDHSIGFFCGGKKGNVLSTLRRAIDGTLPRSELTRMRVDLNGKTLHARVLNEALFCHASPAATSRYILRVTRANGTFVEEDVSARAACGSVRPPARPPRSAAPAARCCRSARGAIQYVVREPYQHRSASAFASRSASSTPRASSRCAARSATAASSSTAIASCTPSRSATCS